MAKKIKYVNNLDVCNVSICKFWNVQLNWSFFLIVHNKPWGKIVEANMSRFWFAWMQVGDFSEDIFASKVAMLEQICLAYQVV